MNRRLRRIAVFNFATWNEKRDFRRCLDVDLIESQCVHTHTCITVSLVLLAGWKFTRLRFYGQSDVGDGHAGVACVHTSVFERHVEDAKGALLRNLILAWFRQIIVILAPLNLRPVVLLHRALDFHLRAVEDGGGTADLQADLLHSRVVLDVLGITGGDRRTVVFRRARFHVASLLIARLLARAHRVESSHFVILRHRLLAQHGSVLVAGSARLCAARPLANLPSSRAVEDVAVLPIGRGRVGTVKGKQTLMEKVKCWTQTSALTTCCSGQSLYSPRPVSLHECN